MKKFTAILLLTIYGLTSVGATIDLHYCSGKLSKVTLVTEPKKTDCCSEKEMPKDCCKDKLVRLKQTNDQLLYTDNYLKNYFYTVTTFFPDRISTEPVPVLIKCYTSINAPPLINSIRLHLLNGILLI